jgi:hypothetical protein
MRKTNSVNFRFIVFIILASVLLTGCMRTEGTLKLAGKVTEESTKKGIFWKNIIVQGVLYGYGNSEPIEVGQFSTDSAGCFTYSLRKIRGVYNYNFCFTGNYDYPVTIKKMTLFALKRNAKYLSFPLNKLVDLTIKIHKRSKTPVCDTLHLIWESDGIFGLSLYPYKINNYDGTNNAFGLTSGGDLWWIGGNVNSTIDTKVFADKRTELIWDLYRDGKRKEFTDTITCKRDAANTVYFTY